MIQEQLYNMGNVAFGGAMKIASFLHPKAKLFIDGRKGLLSKISSDFKNNTRPVAWFHCASLGEFEQGRPVIEAFRTVFTDYLIVLTFYSPSGYEVQKEYDQADFVYYLPIDTKSNATKFVETIQPKIAFFVKYEFWHNYLNALKKNSSRIISFSTIFRPDQAFFKKGGGFQQNMLKKFDFFFTQDQRSFDLLSQININSKEIAGDTRFDRVAEICASPKQIPLAQQFSEGNQVAVVGSSWPLDIEALSKSVNSISSLKWIIAPHEISDKKIQFIIDTFSSRKCIRYSKATTENINQYDILIIDNIGMLSSLYQFADFAYVGGAFKEGLHNILEPATFGIPIVIGAEFSKFIEAIALVERKGVISIQSSEECLSIIKKLVDDVEFRTTTGRITKQYVNENLGSTEKIISYCQKIISENQ
ncbi:3-deoxy-D-manno-octulosonic acid transferase [Flammeovirga yaeyamensis]|uniref:3-deoxy-D-manno-octulosonic acid transferase n=1 Tax=Flammeovirga yaeyamensis TaxID=367791 RepID=A0AAX1N1A2_9BACT|nr:glycosyltransferase N-terminal domain-containing protein [Flammeovirga yaeyamensis]MBB3698371.1 3-deoxy-D-manno-octulosonic-acid transferase [Flammeovirga yaeyamensis]NMF34277.1 3-deoxy-D-manno-octulosonic acid transferase [Flammeovirga yaeyamensis]QWG01260.1 3-deoxy-D-manno-octulosonic acid transferase [Flammeovirga yaeyamensis]